MNLSPVQQRRLQQVKNEIALLENQTRKRGVWFAVWFSFLLVTIYYIASYFFDWMTDGTSLTRFIKDISWPGMLSSWIFWFLAEYFFFVRSNHQQLKLKRKELADLEVRYSLVEETVS